MTYEEKINWLEKEKKDNEDDEDVNAIVDIVIDLVKDVEGLKVFSNLQANVVGNVVDKVWK